MSTLETRNDPFEHGDLSALVCVDEPALQAIVIDQLTQLGFGIHTGLYPEEVAVRLRARTYEIVVVAENFAGGDLETNPALHELGSLSLDQRRASYVILIGPSMESRSEIQAFMCSVDLTLRVEDAENLRVIAGGGIVRHEESYATFHAVRKSVRAS